MLDGLDGQRISVHNSDGSRHLQADHDRDLQGRSGSVASCTEDAELLKTSSHLVHAWIEKKPDEVSLNCHDVLMLSLTGSQGRVQASWRQSRLQVQPQDAPQDETMHTIGVSDIPDVGMESVELAFE